MYLNPEVWGFFVMRRWPHSQILPRFVQTPLYLPKKNANNNRGPEIQPAIKIGHKLIATPISRDPHPMSHFHRQIWQQKRG